MRDTFDSRHAGQTDIEQNHIGRLRVKLSQRFFNRSEAANNAMPGRATNQRGKSFARLLLIFDDGDLDFLTHATVATVTQRWTMNNYPIVRGGTNKYIIAAL